MNLIGLGLVLFGGGGGYAPTPPPAVPTEDDPMVKAEKESAAKKEREMAIKRKGRSSTILTSGLGLSGSPNVDYAQLTGNKTKLGQ